MEDLIYKFAKLYMALYRLLQKRNYSIFLYVEDFNEFLYDNKDIISFEEAGENLNRYISTLSFNDKLIKDASELLTMIKSSDYKDYRITYKLNLLNKDELIFMAILRNYLFLLNISMIDSKQCSKLFNVSKSGIKQACQQNRLSNSIKVGGNWLISIYECKDYWK